MKPSLRSLVFAVLAFSFLTLLQSPEFVLAENRFVAVTGDDANPGTRKLPWRTLRKACVSLEPGDQLLVGPGEYVEFNDDGIEDFDDTIFVRAIGNEENGHALQPFIGDPEKTTVIRPLRQWSMPKVYGNFDIRGSYIRISGLEIIGNPERSIEPGIGVYSSHDIACNNNLIHNHGGGGISFNQSDMVSASGNICHSNATTNPNQSSGISSYQPIRRSPSELSIGVRFQFNLCFDNSNQVPGEFGITDGNGLILDDHRYTQTNQQILDAMAGLEDANGAGVPVIETEEQINMEAGDDEPSVVQIALPYDRKSLVWGNVCFGNGGRGVHVFLSHNALITRNLVYNNLQSSELFSNLPVDNDGEPLFRNGELSVADSTEITVGSNMAIATFPFAVAANEFWFEIQPSGPEGNNWRRNGYFNNQGDSIYSLVGVEEAESNLVKDVNSDQPPPAVGF